jgi:hypothetical protein
MRPNLKRKSIVLEPFPKPGWFRERLEPMALEKAVLRPLFPSKSKVAFPKQKFWESLFIY